MFVCFLFGGTENMFPWNRRIEKRNKDVMAGKTNAYYIVNELVSKWESIFEKPSRNEMDVWIQSQIPVCRGVFA